MIKCFSPWTNLDISPTGNISPCCKFRTQYYEQKFNIQSTTIEQYVNSDLLQTIKKDFNNGIWPVGCERCRIDEDNLIPSKRQLDYNRWKSVYKSYDNNGFITASIGFGNICNLTCITCSPNASSKWRKEYQAVYGVKIPKVEFLGNTFEDQFKHYTKNLIHLDIPGGEPLLSNVELQKRLLNSYIETGQSKHITLHYTTNAQIFPDSEWWDLWKNFCEIDLQLSVDGIEKQYEYIRFPASWEMFLDNASKYLKCEEELSNFRLSVSHTVSAYNIFYLDDFYNWCLEFGLPKPYLGRVHTPIHMRPEVWPTNIKQIIIDRLNKSQHQEVKNWCNILSTNNIDKHEEFYLYLKKHDEYRGLNFNETFPELAEIAFG
jgi:hypothetical protein